MTIIIRPPVGGLDMRDLLVTLDAMRVPGDPPLKTGSGGFVVGEDLARRFLVGLAADQEPPAPAVYAPPPAPWVPPAVAEPEPPHAPPSAPAAAPTATAPTPPAQPVTTADPAHTASRRGSRSRRTTR